MKACHCISEPPIFDLPPPPDPSLIWNLLSIDEKFKLSSDCATTSPNQLVSITDVGSSHQHNLFGDSSSTSDSDDIDEIRRQQLTINILIGVATFSILFLIAVCIAVIGRIRRRKLEEMDASKKMSTDSILVAGEHLWTYNSMKPSSSVLMYSNNSNNGSRLFHHTPTTLRSYIGNATPIIANQNIPIRHSESTTLRLNPNDTCSAYHTLSVTRQQAANSTDVYEEIAPVGYNGSIGYMTTTRQPLNQYPQPSLLLSNGRMSMRRPPPTCRPPQPPQSPAISDGSSYDKEITRITTLEGVDAASSPHQWNDDPIVDGGGGRESGYGTAPSLQWKSPSGSSSSPCVIAQAPPNPHTMTYV